MDETEGAGEAILEGIGDGLTLRLDVAAFPFSKGNLPLAFKSLAA